MNWDDNLPDVSTWQPDPRASETLETGLLLTCQAAQRRIIAEAEIERGFNIDGFDSGLGVEDIVRQELSKLLPDRYAIDPGVVNDRDGKTAGDCDILVRDRTWSPATKLGATAASRRYHFAIESIYSAIEVKQTLGFQELDLAMEKLVKLARLKRPDNPYGHITENQHLKKFDKNGWILNPLHTTVFGTRIQQGISFQDIAFRFRKINNCLGRREMVTMLCILGQGAAWYSEKDGNAVNATFIWDRNKELQLSVHDDDQDKDNTFYRFFVHLGGHLYRSVLFPSNLAEAYGVKVAPYKNYPCNNAKFNNDL